MIYKRKWKYIINQSMYHRRFCHFQRLSAIVSQENNMNHLILFFAETHICPMWIGKTFSRRRHIFLRGHLRQNTPRN